MSGNCSQDLQSLLPELEKSRLSITAKNAIQKNSCDENLKTSEQSFDIMEEGTVTKNECELQSSSVRSNAESMEVNSKFLSKQSDSESPVHTARKAMLNSMLEFTDEDDLLCKISVTENEISVDTEDEEEFLNFEYTLNLEEFDQRNMVNNKFNLSLFEKQKVPALQIGMAIPVPVLSVEEANFSKSVSRVLKALQFYGPSCIQSVVWPAVERGRDMFVVAPPHSGKTVSYVVPLVARYTSENNAIEEDKGPHTIILCSTWRKAHAVKEHFQLFLGQERKKIFILYTTGGHYKNKIQARINNCDILISTPLCLLEFFQDHLITFSRLGEFVVDDGSAVMIKHKIEFKEIILCIMEAIRKSQCSPQLIICSERWNKSFQIIADKVMRNTLLYFTSFLEAAIYAKIPINAHVCESKNMKKSIIYGIVKAVSQRVVICTTDMQDACEIHLFLTRLKNSLKCNSYLLNEEMEHFIADDVIKCWKAADTKTGCQILVVTDCVVTDMRISCADCLIHFDVPLKSRLQFGNRFSVIAEYFTNKESSSNCACHVLILESEYFHAANLVEIIENSGGVPNEKLVELSKMHVKNDNISADLCYNLKAFGVCLKTNCENRHEIISDVDKPQIVPYEGDIHGVVTHIIDASHYYVRLVKYLDPTSNKTVSFVGTYAKIGFQLRDFYLQASDDLKVETPVVGESYVLEEDNKLFFRIKILGCIPESSTHLAQWKVLYLDEGWIKHCKVLKLYKISSEVDLPKPLAVEVFACDMAPSDSSFDWNPHTSKFVSDLLKGKEIHGKIVLCLGSTLWLDPLAVTVRLSDGHYVYPFKIDQKLLDYGHIIKRPNHVELLFKACGDKIPLPQRTKPKDKEEKIDLPEPTIRYAFLDCNVYEEVYVSCVVSPDQLYVQRAKFVDCLDDLLEKINSQVEKKKLKKAYTVFKDMICLAPFFEDNRYYRAIVTDLLPDDKLSVFYVDFGDTGTVAKKDLFSISAEFLLLPFQAIECELAGIKASHGGWTESAISTLMFLTRDEEYDMKTLQLKAYSKTSSYSCGNRYVVDLWDNDKKLSEKLLEAGFGVPEDLSTEVIHDNSLPQTHNSLDLNVNKSSSLDEEDMDPEDKEITTNFYLSLAEMYAKEYNLSPLSKTSGPEDSDDEETILKKCNFTKSSASNLKQDNLQNILPKLDQLKKILPSSEPPKNSVRPLITWWDTPEELNILINLREIKIYELHVKDKTLSFNTIVAGVQYTTDENFYEKINSSDAKIEHIVQGIKIVAKKSTPFKWPRLTKEKKKFFHIKYDLLHIEDSDSEESSKPNKEKSKQDMRYLYEEDGSSSTDEEETYVESWKEFATHKDPVSELLSEI